MWSFPKNPADFDSEEPQREGRFAEIRHASPVVTGGSTQTMYSHGIPSQSHVGMPTITFA